MAHGLKPHEGSAHTAQLFYATHERQQGNHAERQKEQAGRFRYDRIKGRTNTQIVKESRAHETSERLAW